MEDSPIGNHGHDAGSDAQRRDERDSLLVLARITPDGPAGGGAAGIVETVRVRNVSTGGLMAQSSTDYRIGAGLTVELDGIGKVRGSVAWTEAGRIGIAFDHPIDKARARKPSAVKTLNTTEAMIQSLSRDTRRPPVKPR